MGDTPEKIQWHSAFCAATELELEANIESLELKSEYNLSKEPIRIDLLIINHVSGRLHNEIGHLMKRYNIIEYKSPEDGLTIDDFYKTIGYACLYKGYGDYVNEIPLYATMACSPSRPFRVAGRASASTTGKTSSAGLSNPS